MALYSDGGLTSPDIWLVIIFVSTALVSILLNPLVLRHNFFKKRSLPRDLYMALATTDFLTSVVMTISYSIVILKPKEDSCMKNNQTNCEDEYYLYARPATVTENVVSSFLWYLLFSPIILTSVLATGRWYQIKYPLRVLKRSLIETVTAVLCLLIMVYYICRQVYESSESLMVISILKAVPSAPCGYDHDSLELLDSILGIILSLTATVASVLTIRDIAKTSRMPRTTEQPGRRLKSAIKIALLNAGSTVQMLLIIGRIIMVKQGMDRTFLFATFHTILTSFLPILMSSYNPIVYVLLSNGNVITWPQNRVVSTAVEVTMANP